VADPRWTRGLVEQRATRGVSRIVCVSEGVAAQCRRRGFAAEKLAVIPNGIDVERWANARPADLTQFGVPAGQRVFTFVGRLEAQKGIIDLLTVVLDFLKEVPSHDFLVVGDGPLREQLNDRTSALEGKRVHFAGWQADIPAIMAASDLLLLYSGWEGMPNVVLEAMAAGKPVLALPAEGINELLGEGHTEQTAEARYLQRLMELIGNPVLQNDLGRRNQARAKQEFSLACMICRYADLYESLARSKT
jgi:starch synthase (maltosyl-transferring)